MIPPCPNCEARITYSNAQARGTAEFHYSETGELLELFTEKQWFQASSTIRCAECGKIRHDLVRDGTKVVVREQT